MANLLALGLGLLPPDHLAVSLKQCWASLSLFSVSHLAPAPCQDHFPANLLGMGIQQLAGDIGLAMMDLLPCRQLPLLPLSLAVGATSGSTERLVLSWGGARMVESRAGSGSSQKGSGWLLDSPRGSVCISLSFRKRLDIRLHQDCVGRIVPVRSEPWGK